MKHLLIILFFLLLSSPLFGDNHEGETLYRWGESPNFKWRGFGEKENHPIFKGQVINGIPNGKGTIIYPDGHIYEGEFKDGKYNGLGIFTFGKGEWEGDKYVGEFKDGEINGQGTYTNYDGGSNIGKFKDGLLDGQGTETFPNGDKYVGEFKGGKRNGKGTYTWVDGRKYVGEFKGGKANGQGTNIFQDGWKYIGEFKNGIEFNGVGYNKNGGIDVRVVNGEWIKQ